MAVMLRGWSTRFIVTLSVVLGAWTQVESQQARLIWLGTLGGSDSVAYGVSADGSVVVGASVDGGGRYRAFRWTAQTGMVDLGALPPYSGSAARGVSADGATVVGVVADNPFGYLEECRAFIRTATGGMQYLPPLSDWDSFASAVSADGSVVVGFAAPPETAMRAFRWSAQTGIEWLSAPNSLWTAALDISADKRCVVGTGETPSGILAFRWENGVAQALTSPAHTPGRASGVSADGSVVVGQINLAGATRAFRWQNGVLQIIGEGSYTAAHDVSADGEVVVGEAGGRAFRWTAHTGLQNLNRVYSELIRDGSEMQVAHAVSPNGRYIVGIGWNRSRFRYEAFLLDTGAPLNGDVNRDGCVDDSDLLSVLFAFGTSGYRNEDLNWDGEVNDADLLTVLFHFGQGC